MQQTPPIKTKSRTKPSTMSPETTRPQPLNQTKTRENHHEKRQNLAPKTPFLGLKTPFLGQKTGKKRIPNTPWQFDKV
jgi:hypothetical protein